MAERFVLCWHAASGKIVGHRFFDSQRESPCVTKPHKSWTHWLLPAVKFLVFVLLCWFIYRTVESTNDDLSKEEWHVDGWWLAASAVLYLAGLFPSAVFWQRVCVCAGQDVKFGEAIRAHFISQLGKYVPGKWMVIVLRRAAGAFARG